MVSQRAGSPFQAASEPTATERSTFPTFPMGEEGGGGGGRLSNDLKWGDAETLE